MNANARRDAVKSLDAQDVLRIMYGDNAVPYPIDILAIAENFGIDVYRAHFDHAAIGDTVNGFIEEQKDGSTRIVVNAADPSIRRRYTVAHELSAFFAARDEKHMLRHVDFQSVRHTIADRSAAKFAAALLIPEKELRKEHGKLMWPTLGYLAKKFDVQPEIMRERLTDLGLDFIKAA